MNIFLPALTFWNLIQFSISISHEKTLMWTEKLTSGNARIIGIGGDPNDWILADELQQVGQARPTDPVGSGTSNRIALAYRYASMNIYWSDRGFRQIVKSKLQEHDNTPYIYNSTLNRIYSGTSVEVNGLAVDWVSGSIYWSDALYDWITVANVDKLDIYNHIITTQIEKPMGVVVHPKKGKLYWADSGTTVRKIEVSNLDGSGRKILAEIQQGEPIGLTIDYVKDELFWVDSFQETINKYDLNLGTHVEVKVKTTFENQQIGFFGIAVYDDMIITTDQMHPAVRIFNRTTYEHIRSLPIGGTPYDVMMYDQEQQEPFQSQCSVLHCEHICVSMGEGKAKCLCAQGYQLNTDGVSCQKSSRIFPPMYIYSVGSKLCSARISIADRQNLDSLAKDIDCFYTNVSHAEALAFHAEAETLYYSDSVSNTIEKLSLQKNFYRESVAVQTGKVSGIDVDWLSSNIYWTDEEFGQIMVADLRGRFPRVVIDGLSKPRGIAVNAQTGMMYWADAIDKCIWKANMDGTNKTLFRGDMTSPDGVALVLDENRLYWLENLGIRSASLYGLEKKSHVDIQTNAVGDVAVYQDYIAYTDGKGNVNYVLKYGGKAPYVIPHVESYASHDIITYSPNIQPIDKPGHCDLENGGCSQLCLPTPTGKTCACSYGFTLQQDQKTCSTQLVEKQFLLTVDPYQRQIFQISLEKPELGPQGISLPQASFPTKVDLNPNDGHVYWLDLGGKVIKRAPLQGPDRYNGPYLFNVYDHSTISAFIVSGFTDEIIYADTADEKLYRVNLQGNIRNRRLFSDNVPTNIMVLDNDPDTGNVYWVETYGQSVIFQQSVYEPANSKIEVWSSDDTIKGIAVSKEEGKLYWVTDTKVGWVTLDKKDHRQIYENTSADFSAITVTKTDIWLSMTNSKLLYQLQKDATPKLKVFSGVSFTRIGDVKSYEWFDGKPTRRKIVIADGAGVISDGGRSISLPALGGIVAAAAIALLLLILLGFVLYKKCLQKKLPPSDFETAAHENPTYDTPPGMTAAAMTATAPIKEESPYEKLPDERKRPESTASRDSYLPDVVNAGQDQPSHDTEQLVSLQSEITMDINDTVSYNPSKK